MTLCVTSETAFDMGWYGYKDLEFDTDRERLTFVLKNLLGNQCELIDYERVPISMEQQRLEAIDYKNEYYLAVDFSKQYPNQGIGAVVFLERVEPKRHDYKTISEEAGPAIRCCPKRILDKLIPTANKNAQEWRDDCMISHRQRERHKQRRSGKSR